MFVVLRAYAVAPTARDFGTPVMVIWVKWIASSDICTRLFGSGEYMMSAEAAQFQAADLMRFPMKV